MADTHTHIHTRFTPGISDGAAIPNRFPLNVTVHGTIDGSKSTVVHRLHDTSGQKDHCRERNVT